MRSWTRPVLVRLRGAVVVVRFLALPALRGLPLVVLLALVATLVVTATAASVVIVSSLAITGSYLALFILVK